MTEKRWKFERGPDGEIVAAVLESDFGPQRDTTNFLAVARLAAAQERSRLLEDMRVDTALAWERSRVTNDDGYREALTLELLVERYERGEHWTDKE